jgi:valyl-tRNA synthetase
MNVAGKDVGLDGAKPRLTFVDRWIISRLQQAEEDVNRELGAYRFDLAAKALYEFVWDEYCDWYVELAKVQLADADPDVQRGTRRTLVRVLEAVLRLAHPFIPFITEELWQAVAPIAGKAGETIMLQPYPQPDDDSRAPAESTQVGALKNVVDAIRSLRSEMELAPGEKVDALIAGDVSRNGAEAFAPYVMALSRLSDYRVVDELPKSDAPVQVVDVLQIMLDLRIDPAIERERIAKKLAQVEADIARAQAKLANAGFVDRAPPAVVEQERARLAAFNETRERLLARREQLV